MMKSRVQTAVDYYAKSGYNCSQALAVTYADLLGLDPMVCFKGMETFGCGMGGKLGTCGAISGAIYLAGFVTSTGHMDDDKTNKSKKESYDLAGRITRAFYEKNQTVTCGDMKEPKSPKFRSCLDCIADAAILAEEMIFPGQFEKSTYFEDKANR
ncbi:MAG: C-GCAxxG-C-C family protein [Lachnospiraceae bacterium]|nr:C-GCAxxG-C-C family protein [Lachnospiraceae bacterium]